MEGVDLCLLKRPEVFEFEGITMVHYFTDNWENVQKFQARPDDILIATYPKAGTTWVSYILDLLYFGNVAPERQTSTPIYMRVPFLETYFPPIASGVELANKLPTTPRLIKTHLPLQLVPKSFWEQNCRLKRPEVFEFEGITMVHYFTDNWENVQKFQARPDDILIATYPKAGTTWVSYILDLLYFSNVAPERQTSTPIYIRVPFLEGYFPPLPSGVEMVNKLPTTPRLIKTHLPVQLVPKSFWEQNCRVIYVARNAKDNAVSYFHFERMNKGQPDPGHWDTFIQSFMEGKKVFGPWYDHVCGYWEKKQTYSNLHYMFYEDMVEDIGHELQSLCSFLGLSTPIEERERIMKSTHFDSMKQNSMTNYSTLPALDFTISPFMRKGKVGDWKNHFTVAQNEQFDEHYKEKMKNTTLEFRTEL